MNSVDTTVMRIVKNQLLYKILDAVKYRVDYQVKNDVKDETVNKIWDQIDSTLYFEVKEQLGKQVYLHNSVKQNI
jgi:hypothetical protein